MNLVFSIILFSMFPYLYYIKRNPAFLFTAVIIALPCSLYIYFSWKYILIDIKKDSENRKYHCIMFFITWCLSMIGVIIVLLECN